MQRRSLNRDSRRHCRTVDRADKMESPGCREGSSHRAGAEGGDISAGHRSRCVERHVVLDSGVVHPSDGCAARDRQRRRGERRAAEAEIAGGASGVISATAARRSGGRCSAPSATRREYRNRSQNPDRSDKEFHRASPSLRLRHRAASVVPTPEREFVDGTIKCCVRHSEEREKQMFQSVPGAAIAPQ